MDALALLGYNACGRAPKPAGTVSQGATAVQPLDLLPASARVDGAGRLWPIGCLARDLAGEFGTLLYVYDEATLVARCHEAQAALAGYPGTSRVAYATTAFLCLGLAQLLAREGPGLDVVSAGELAVAQAAGYPRASAPARQQDARRARGGPRLGRGHHRRRRLARARDARRAECRPPRATAGVAARGPGHRRAHARAPQGRPARPSSAFLWRREGLPRRCGRPGPHRASRSRACTPTPARSSSSQSPL